MDYIKYIAFGVSLISLVIEKFIRTKKDEKSDFEQSSKFGRFLIVISFLAFGVGVWQTIQGDNASVQKERAANEQRKRDSTLLSKRWEFDTLRFKQLLDSSEVIINNSLANIEKANINIKATENLLVATEVQKQALGENISLTKKLNFPLPYTIGLKFLFKYDLDSLKDVMLMKYLDSVSYSNDARLVKRIEYSKATLNYTNLDTRKSFIWSLLNFFLLSDLTFVHNHEPILRLKSNFLFVDSTYENKVYNAVDLEYDTKQKIVFITLDKFPIEMKQERMQGITSLMDLDGSHLYLTSNPLFGDIDAGRLLAHVILNIDSRDVWFDYLFAYPPTNENVAALKKNGIHIWESPFLFKWDINEELLRGYKKSLKDDKPTGLPGSWFYHRNPK